MNFDLEHLADDKKTDFVDLALQALSYIYKLVGGSNADNAGSIITVLRVLLKHVEEAYKGDLTPAAARHELQKLLDAIAQTDTEIDADIKKKFGQIKKVDDGTE